jgi:hypothetical protein
MRLMCSRNLITTPAGLEGVIGTHAGGTFVGLPDEAAAQTTSACELGVCSNVNVVIVRIAARVDCGLQSPVMLYDRSGVLCYSHT